MLRSQPASTPLAIKLTEPITYLKSKQTFLTVPSAVSQLGVLYFASSR